MTGVEMQEIIMAVSKIDLITMDYQDQLTYIAAMGEMAKKVKPLVVKYADRLPGNETFLLKLGSSEKE